MGIDILLSTNGGTRLKHHPPFPLALTPGAKCELSDQAVHRRRRRRCKNFRELSSSARRNGAAMSTALWCCCDGWDGILGMAVGLEWSAVVERGVSEHANHVSVVHRRASANEI